MATPTLGGISPARDGSRTQSCFHHRARRTRNRAHGEFKIPRAGRGDFAADFRTAAVSRGAGAGGRVHFRRHRPAAFCRRAGRADNFAVRPEFARALGADWKTTPDFDRRGLRLRWPFRRLHRRAPLPRGDFAGTRFGCATKRWSADSLVRELVTTRTRGQSCPRPELGGQKVSQGWQNLFCSTPAVFGNNNRSPHNNCLKNMKAAKSAKDDATSRWLSFRPEIKRSEEHTSE